MYMTKQGNLLTMVYSLFSLLIVLVQWWRDVIRESTFQGKHSFKTQKGLYLGFLMFIASEVMFFFSFFFAFFFSALNPDISLGLIWPPIGVEPMSYLGVPLLNTIILLSSGVSVTWAHHSLLDGVKNQTFNGLLATVICGMVFMYFQILEYFECSFTIADSVFGSIFFSATGFHGLHVTIGVLFLLIAMIRTKKLHLTPNHHIGFEVSAWYWHFVDVVWLFLFVSIYWWGS
nr:cytochrome c oxidase subunit 3 [Chelopistes texanus]